jgi:type III secretion protein S
MDMATLVTYVKQSLLLILLLSAPAVLTAALVGLVVAFLQAVTQVQDQTVAFGIKLIAAIFAIVVSANWLGSELYQFADQLFTAVADVR